MKLSLIFVQGKEAVYFDQENVSYKLSMSTKHLLLNHMCLTFRNYIANLVQSSDILCKLSVLQSTPKSAKGSAKKEGSKRKINMSGYILFSSEMRAVIKAQHPDYSFGELSRLVGTEWRNLETAKKAEYEGK